MPPPPATNAVPLQSPKHNGFTTLLTDAVTCVGSVKLIVVVPVQLFPSVAVIVYIVVAHKPVKLPFVGCNGPDGNILNVYPGAGTAGVPPPPVTLTVPLHKPKHVIFVLPITVAVTGVGSVIFTVITDEHEF